MAVKIEIMSAEEMRPIIFKYVSDFSMRRGIIVSEEAMDELLTVPQHHRKPQYEFDRDLLKEEISSILEESTESQSVGIAAAVGLSIPAAMFMPFIGPILGLAVLEALRKRIITREAVIETLSKRPCRYLWWC